MFTGTTNRRDLIRAGALMSFLALMPDLDFFNGSVAGTIVSSGKCVFPRPMSSEEYFATLSKLHDTSAMQRLVAGFIEEGRILNESFEIESQAATWTLEFSSLDSFHYCFEKMNALFDHQALEQTGFKRELTVKASGEVLIFKKG